MHRNPAGWMIFGLTGLLSYAPALAQVEEGSQAIIVSSTATSDGGPAAMSFQAMSVDSDGNTMVIGGPTMTGDGLMVGLPPMFGSDPLSLLSLDGVRQEIDLVAEQQAQMETIRQEFASRMKDAVQELRSGNFDPAAARGIGERIRQLQDEQHRAMREVLLPHQIQRLEQVALQSRMRAAGASAALADRKLMEELGITEEQRDRIRSRAEELAKELQAKIEALREESREKLLSETLTSEQREKLKRLMGDRFEGDLQPRIELPKRGLRQRLGAGGGDSGDR